MATLQLGFAWGTGLGIMDVRSDFPHVFID